MSETTDAPTPRETGACQYDCDRPYATGIACGMERAESDRSWGRDTACGCSCHAVDNKTLLAMYEDQRSMEHAHKTSKLASHTRLAEIANATEQHILQRLDTANATPRPDAASASVTRAMVHRVADEVRNELRVDSGIVGHTVGQKSHRLDGVDALEEALVRALAAAPRDAGREEVVLSDGNVLRHVGDGTFRLTRPSDGSSVPCSEEEVRYLAMGDLRMGLYDDASRIAAVIAAARRGATG